MRQAQACEDAITARCRCRCGGALHGAGRGEVVELPAEDPHAPARPEVEQLVLLEVAS